MMINTKPIENYHCSNQLFRTSLDYIKFDYNENLKLSINDQAILFQPSLINELKEMVDSIKNTGRIGKYVDILFNLFELIDYFLRNNIISLNLGENREKIKLTRDKYKEFTNNKRLLRQDTTINSFINQTISLIEEEIIPLFQLIQNEDDILCHSLFFKDNRSKIISSKEFLYYKLTSNSFDKWPGFASFRELQVDSYGYCDSMKTITLCGLLLDDDFFAKLNNSNALKELNISSDMFKEMFRYKGGYDPNCMKLEVNGYNEVVNGTKIVDSWVSHNSNKNHG